MVSALAGPPPRGQAGMQVRDGGMPPYLAAPAAARTCYHDNASWPTDGYVWASGVVNVRRMGDPPNSRLYGQGLLKFPF